MVYEWSGYAYKLPAQIVGEKLEEIESKYGEVTKENFLNESRSADSPTHSLFDWDDAVAGEKWRLQQSKTIIGNIRITVTTSDPEPVSYKVRAFANKEEDNNNTTASYISFGKAMAVGSEYRDVVIRNAKRELHEFANKYRSYTEFARVIEAIDDLEERA